MVTVVITAFCSAVAGNVLSARVLREFQRAAGWFRDVMGTEEQCGESCGILCPFVCLSAVIATQAILLVCRLLLRETLEVPVSCGGVPQGCFFPFIDYM